MRIRKMRKANEITFSQLLDTYEGIAATERVKMGKPSKVRVTNAINDVKNVLRACNVNIEAKVTTMTRRRFDEYAVKAIGSGLSSTTVQSYFNSFDGLTAKWTSVYYHERKMKVPKFDTPKIFVEPKRYTRPSEELTQKVVDWYKSLERKKDISTWGVVAMMLEFAMRNGDVCRLTWANFKKRGDDVYLEYTPHKTAKSSGRRVICRVAPRVWRRLKKLRGRDATDITPIFTNKNVKEKIFYQNIAKQMRSFGFTGSKSIYELRKMCIDNVYRHFGAEAASAISGDDIRTVLKYYADGSICNIGDVRITDLMTKRTRT